MSLHVSAHAASGHAFYGSSEWLTLFRNFTPAEIVFLNSWGTPAADLVLTDDGERLLIDCVRRFMELGRSMGESSVPSPHVPRTLLRRQTPRDTQSWSGFVPTGDDWISMAVSGGHEREIALNCLKHMGAVTDDFSDLAATKLPVTQLAAELQAWGIASFPAYQSQLHASHQPADIAQHDFHSFPDVLFLLGIRPSNVLAGARVVDCGQLISAPWAGALLATWGAEVICVAHPARATNRWYGEDPVLLDLESRGDRQIFESLCNGAHLVLDNFRTRVWNNLAIDPIRLGARRHLSLPAFPSDDSRSNAKCYGFQLEGLYGVGHIPSFDATQAVPSSSKGLLDHCVGFAAATLAAYSMAGGTYGRTELSHLSLLQQLRDDIA